MELLVQTDPAAKAVVIAVVLYAVLGEAAVTYAATTHDAAAAPRGRLIEAARAVTTTVLPHRRGHGPTDDRRTRELLVLGVSAALVAEWAIARTPGLRLGANTWLTLVAGAVIAALGITLRLWSIRTLGRFFQRQVVVETGQTVVRDGPYRRVRHPAYSGNVLMVFGVGLMLGSWLGAVAGCLIALAALLPRIRVEERVLRSAFAGDYAGYAATTARLVPGIW